MNSSPTNVAFLLFIQMCKDDTWLEHLINENDRLDIVLCEKANPCIRGVSVDEDNDKITLEPLKNDTGRATKDNIAALGILVRTSRDHLSNPGRTPLCLLDTRLLRDRNTSWDVFERIQERKPSAVRRLVKMFVYFILGGRPRQQRACEAPFVRTAQCVAGDGGEELLNFIECDATWWCLSPVPGSRSPSVQHLDRGRLFPTSAELDACLSVAEHLTPEYAERWLRQAAEFGQVEISRFVGSRSVTLRLTEALDQCALNGDRAGAEALDVESPKQLAARQLLKACTNSQESFVDFLLVEHPALDPNEALDADGMSALHHAARNGSQRIIKMLLSRGADLAARDRYGRNVLHHAAEAKRELAMDILIQEAKGNGRLMELINQQDFFYGRDVFVLARQQNGAHKVWKWLKLERYMLQSYHSIRNTNDVHVQRFGVTIASGSGWDPDSDVCQRIRAEQERLLGSQHSDLTPLHLAVLQPSLPLARRLLDEGADPDAADHFGCTAAHYAAMTGSVECLELLQSKGADLKSENNDSLTVVDVARLNDQVEVIKMLEIFPITHRVQTFHHSIDQYVDKLKVDVLQSRRHQGQCLRLHVIEQIRDLQVDINILLVDLGLAPLKAV